MAPKVLLIGWDAADWKVMAPLMDAGRMLHLASLASPAGGEDPPSSRCSDG